MSLTKYTHVILFSVLGAGYLVNCNYTGDTSDICYVTVNTDAGKIRGARRDCYYSFRNVTFAKQPLGDLRFQELKYPEPWKDEVDAVFDGPICPQSNIFYGPLMSDSGVSEACIHANVHVPVEAPISIVKRYPCRLARELRPPTLHARVRPGLLRQEAVYRKPLPIFVFIHGGGFSFGSGNADLHGPEYLVKNGVIVVTFNYRLNAFGFLSLGSSEVPGNAGLRDIVTLLRWVQRNAANFGGDPNNITFGGQSAGAVAAHILSLLPDASALFKRFISMSGTASSGFFTTSPTYAAQWANIFKKILNIDGFSNEETYNFLLNASVSEIQMARAIIHNQIGLTDFTPVVETAATDTQPIISTDLEKTINEGKGNPNTPRILGFTQNECLVFKHRFESLNILDIMKKKPILILPPNLILKLTPEDLLQASKDIVARYFDDNPTIGQFVKYCSDAMLTYPILNTAEKSGVNTYLYRFSYHGSAWDILSNATGSVCFGNEECGKTTHLEDLLYIFKTNSYPNYPYTVDDVLMQDTMTALFSNFIKTGRPSVPLGGYTHWKPVEKNRLNFLDIRGPGDLVMVDFDEQLLDMKKFFDSIYNKIGKAD